MNTRLLFLAFAAALAILPTRSLQAANGTWNVDAASGWFSPATNWFSSIVPGATSGTTNQDKATFGSVITGARTITLTAGMSIRDIEFAGNSFAYTMGAVTLNLTDGGTISTSGGGNGTFADRFNSFVVLQNGVGGSGNYTLDASSTNAGHTLLFDRAVVGNATVGNTTTLFLTGTNGGVNRLLPFSDGAGGGKAGITKNGTTTWSIGGGGADSLNNFSGPVQVNQGILRVDGAAQGTALGRATAITLANTAGATLDLNSQAQSIGSLAGGGASGGNVTLGSAVLTTGYSNTDTTYAGAISGSGQLHKYGTGNFTLTGTNTYTGATAARGGTLSLDFSAAGAPTTNIISASSQLQMSNSGRLALTASVGGNNSQTFASTALSAGASSIALTGDATANPIVLNMGNIPRGFQTGATLDFILPTGTQSATNGVRGSTILGNGVVNGNHAAYATVGGNTWASSTADNATGNIISFTGYSTGAGNYTAANNIDVTNGDAPTSGVTVNTLRFNGNNALTLGGTNTVSQGGILITSAANSGALITGGTLQAGGGGRELVIINNGAQFTVNSTIQDNSAASALTLSGTGTTILAGNNTYTGATFVNSGTVRAGSSTAFGVGSTMNIADNPNAVLDLNGNNISIGGLVGAATRGSTIGTLVGTSGGTVALGSSTLTIGVGNASGTYAGEITGLAGSSLVKVGTGLQILSGGSYLNFAGNVVIKEGQLNALGPVGHSRSLGTGIVILGDSVANSNNATLAMGLTGGNPNNGNYPILSNAIQLGAGTTGTLLIRGAAANQGGTFTGGVTGTNNLTIDPSGGYNIFITTNAINNTGNLTLRTTQGTIDVQSGGIGSNVQNLTLTSIANFVAITGGGINNAGTIRNNGTGNFQTSLNTNIGSTVTGIIQESSHVSSSLRLAGMNSAFTGPVTVNSGILRADSVTSLGTATAVTVNGGILALNPSTGTMTIGSIAGTSSGAITLAGGASIMDVGSANTSTTFAGNISGASSALRKVGTGTWTLSGNNTYTNATTINQGTLQFGRQLSLYNGVTGNWTAANLVVDSGATAAFNVGGSGEFTSANIDTLKGLGTATTGFRNGARIGLDTTNAAGGNFTYASAIGNTNGVANAIGLTKLGNGTLTLSNTSTYTGATTVSAGTLLVSGTGSINSTSGVAVSSSSTFRYNSTTAYTGGAITNLGVVAGSGNLGATVLSGSGSIDPGNSPGILTAGSTNPTSGLDFNFEFTVKNAPPTWGNATASGNDVLRLTGVTPFSANLTGTNDINLYLNVVSLAASDVFTGGFYTDTNASFLAGITGANYRFYLFNAGGAVIYNGVNYDLYAGPLSFNVGTVATVADFGSGSINGYSMQFTAVPEPSTWALLTLSLCVVLFLRRRRQAA